MGDVVLAVFLVALAAVVPVTLAVFAIRELRDMREFDAEMRRRKIARLERELGLDVDWKGGWNGD